MHEDENEQVLQRDMSLMGVLRVSIRGLPFFYAFFRTMQRIFRRNACIFGFYKLL